MCVKTRLIAKAIKNCILYHSLSFQTCSTEEIIDVKFWVILTIVIFLTIFTRCIFPGKRGHSCKYVKYIKSFFICRNNTPQRARTSSFTRLLDHTQQRTTFGRSLLDEWSARRRDLYLTTPNTHNRQISMPPVGFEPKISAGERPQTYTLDRAANETGY